MFYLAHFLASEGLDLIDSTIDDQPYNYWSELVNMLLTLGIVIGIILFSVWMLKRMSRAKWKQFGNLQHIRVIERRALSPKTSLYLVEILGKGIVVGDSPSGLSLVKEFSDEIDLDMLIEQRIEEEPEPKVSFKEKMFQKAGIAKRA